MSWDRIQRLQRLIKEKVALIILRRLSDPRLGFVTITRAELSRDKSHCRIYYSVLGGSGERSKAQHALAAAQGHIQGQLGKTLRTRFTPHLSFCFDESIEGVIRINETLKELAGEWRAEESPADRQQDTQSMPEEVGESPPDEPPAA